MQVLEGTFLPTCYNCTSDALDQGLGLIGAVIMPHNIYLHSGLVLVSFKSLLWVYSVNMHWWQIFGWVDYVWFPDSKNKTN